MTYINWKRMLAKSSAFEASDRSIAESMYVNYICSQILKVRELSINLIWGD